MWVQSTRQLGLMPAAEAVKVGLRGGDITGLGIYGSKAVLGEARLPRGQWDSNGNFFLGSLGLFLKEQPLPDLGALGSGNWMRFGSGLCLP